MADNSHTIIVSDIHLGLTTSFAKRLLGLLSNASFERLILLGDIFDSHNFNRMTPEHWELLNFLKKINLEKEVIWIRGNHDGEVSGKLAHFMEIRSLEEYRFEWNGKKCIALHGDQFDKRISVKNPIIYKLLFTLWSLVVMVDFKNRIITRIISRLTRYWDNMWGLSDIIAEKAIEYAINQQVDYIFCGHTHEPIIRSHIKDNVTVNYLNTGSWIQMPTSYVTINDDEIAIRKFTPYDELLRERVVEKKASRYGSRRIAMRPLTRRNA